MNSLGNKRLATIGSQLLGPLLENNVGRIGPTFSAGSELNIIY